jgi:hypothetical protein
MASARDSINAAQERLEIAQRGVREMSNPKSARAGLLNAFVWGRMVTFALQNMQNDVPAFSDWYDPIQASLKTNPLMVYFKDLRTEIEKTAENNQTASDVYFGSFDASQIDQLPRPPRAKSFFIGTM